MGLYEYRVSSFSVSAQDFSLHYDWNQNEEYQSWWEECQEYALPDYATWSDAEILNIAPVEDLKIGRASTTSFRNQTPITLNQSSRLDLNVSLNSQLFIEDTSSIMDNPNGNWIINTTLDPDTEGFNLVVSNLFGRNMGLTVEQIGLVSHAAEVINDSDITISSDIQGEVSSSASMSLRSENKTPTDEEMTQADTPMASSFVWSFNPVAISSAELNAYVGLFGMFGSDSAQSDATLVNNGAITINGHFDVIEKTDSNFFTNIEEFEKFFRDCSSLSLTINDENIKALTDVYHEAYAYGLYGRSFGNTVSLINKGTITFNTDEHFQVAGIVADVSQNGKVFASNTGI